MVMVPYRADWQAFIANTIASVERGEIPMARIDDAVRRILRVKLRAGLFDKPRPSARPAGSGIGTPEHRAVAREAVRKSLVLLKNNGQALPLARGVRILVAGKAADSLPLQSGGWSLTWQGTGNTNADFGGGTTLWQAIQRIAPRAVLDTSADGRLGDAGYDPLYRLGHGLSHARPGTDQPAYDETSPALGCGMPPGGGVAGEPMPVFDGSNPDTWAVGLAGPSNWGGVPVALATGSSTRTSAQEITATPTDDRTGRQWAALRTQWNNAAGLVFVRSTGASETRDLRGFVNAAGALVFDVRVDTPPTDGVELQVECIYPCRGALDITPALAALPADTWFEMAVPLQCLADRGADFSLVSHPFLLYSAGRLSLSLGNVRWEPQRAGNVACTGRLATVAP